MRTNVNAITRSPTGHAPCSEWIKQPSTPRQHKGIVLSMTVITEIGAGELADLIKQVQAGDEVLLTQGNKPVA